MKINLILPAMLLILSSCSKYEINVLSSSDMKKDPNTGKFSTENDSVKITYSFFGHNAPINLDVYNKLNEPMYIDWQRSAFITGDKAVSYASDQVHINGDISDVAVNNGPLSFSGGSIDATANLPKSVVFVPPHTHVGSRLLEVTDQQFDYYASDQFEKQEIPSSTLSGTSLVKVKEFTEDASPLNFKSYITLYTLDKNAPRYMAYQHSFYISKLMKTTDEPQYFGFINDQRGDFFYTSKTTGFGKAATGVALAGALIGVAALEAKHPNSQQ